MEPKGNDMTVRVCPMRDAICPHGMDCPHVDDGYLCKEGWDTPIRAKGNDMADELKPHRYHPSTMHMGDCSICGNLQDDPIHVSSVPPARLSRPDEPTKEMLRAAENAAFGYPRDWARHYKAMLAAAPDHPSPQGAVPFEYFDAWRQRAVDAEAQLSRVAYDPTMQPFDEPFRHPSPQGGAEPDEAAAIISELVRLADMGFEASLAEPEENGNFAVYERANRFLARTHPIGETDGPEPVAWRCFHCDEVFTDQRCAADHFGVSEDCEAACQIKFGAERSLLTALRRAENDANEMMQRLSSETTDSAKAYYAQNARHQEQLRIAEELGFERGMAAITHPVPGGPAPAVSEAEVEAAMKAAVVTPMGSDPSPARLIDSTKMRAALEAAQRALK